MTILTRLTFALALIIGFSATASTGPTGFAVGLGTGVTGIDFSDGMTRTNIGGFMQTVSFGIHVNDFALLVDGTITDFNGSTQDYLADSDVRLKFYFAEDFHLSAMMGMSLYRRSSYNNTVSTFTTIYGGFAGGILGWDLISNNAFRFNINAGAKRFDFGSTNVRQGVVSSDMDLVNHINGLSYFGYIGLDWYL